MTYKFYINNLKPKKIQKLSIDQASTIEEECGIKSHDPLKLPTGK